MATYDPDELAAFIPHDVAAGAMGDYSLTERDMRVVLALFERFRPVRVLDFGVNWGNTAAFLLGKCPWIEAWVGVDLRPELFPERGIVPQQAGHLARDDPRFSLVLTDETVDDLIFQLTYRGETELAPKAYDCILIDANHTEAGTRRDSEACERFAALPCLWIWHDYDVVSRQNPAGVFGVKAYLDGLIAQGREIWTPVEESRSPWTCCSLAWEVR